VSSKDKLTKEDLKGPDMFVSFSDRLFSWIENNIRAIVAGLSLAGMVAVSFVGYGYWTEGQERKAAEALFKPETELRETESKLREAQAAKMQALIAGKDKAPKIDEPQAADYGKDYAPKVAKITEAIKSHAGTKAALISSLNLANFLIQQKQFPVALEVLEAPKYRPSGNDLLAGFWHMHRGLAYLENQKADEAIKEYKEVLDAKSLKSFHAEAWLKTGVAYELKGDATKARETYEKVSRDFKDTEASNTASQYLRLLDLKPQQG